MTDPFDFIQTLIIITLLAVLGLTILKNDKNPDVNDDECFPDKFRCVDHFECCSKYCYKPLAWINPYKGWCLDEQKTAKREESQEQDEPDTDCKHIDYKCEYDGECCSLNCAKGNSGTKKYGTCQMSDANSLNNNEPLAMGTCSYYKTNKNTASGEPYNKHLKTAAHRTLPFNTLVRVDHQGGPSVVVRINDRGPYTRDQILAVSMNAASEMDILDEDAVACSITVIGTDGESDSESDPVCLPSWYGGCTKDEQCCSGYCHKVASYLPQGMCKPGDQKGLPWDAVDRSAFPGLPQSSDENEYGSGGSELDDPMKDVDGHKKQKKHKE